MLILPLDVEISLGTVSNCGSRPLTLVLTAKQSSTRRVLLIISHDQYTCFTSVFTNEFEGEQGSKRKVPSNGFCLVSEKCELSTCEKIISVQLLRCSRFHAIVGILCEYGTLKFITINTTDCEPFIKIREHVYPDRMAKAAYLTQSHFRTDLALVSSPDGDCWLFSIGLSTFTLHSKFRLPHSISDIVLINDFVAASNDERFFLFNFREMSLLYSAMLESPVVSLLFSNCNLYIVSVLKITAFFLSDVLSRSRKRCIDKENIPITWGDEKSGTKRVIAPTNGHRKSLSISKDDFMIAMDDTLVVPEGNWTDYYACNNCIASWNSEELCLFDVKSETVHRQILTQNQLITPCPSLGGVAILEPNKVSFSFPALSDDSISQSLIKFNNVATMDKIGTFGVNKTASLPSFFLNGSIINVQAELVTYFLVKWRATFAAAARDGDFEPQLFSSCTPYTSSIECMAAELGEGIQNSQTSFEYEALYSQFYQHINEVDQALKLIVAEEAQPIKTCVSSVLRKLRHVNSNLIKATSGAQISLVCALRNPNKNMETVGHSVYQDEPDFSDLTAMQTALLTRNKRMKLIIAQQRVTKKAASIYVNEPISVSADELLVKLNLEPSEMAFKMFSRSFLPSLVKRALELASKSGHSQVQLGYLAKLGSQDGVELYPCTVSSFLKFSSTSLRNVLLDNGLGGYDFKEKTQHALKFEAWNDLSDYLSDGKVSPSFLLDTLADSGECERRHDLLNRMFVLNNLEFPELGDLFKFANFNKMDKLKNSSPISELCQAIFVHCSRADTDPSSSFYNVLDWIDVLSLDIEVFPRHEMRKILLFNKMPLLHAFEKKSKNFVNLYRLNDAQRVVEPEPALGDAVMLAFYYLLTEDEQKKVLERSLEVASIYTKLGTALNPVFSVQTTCTMYDLIDGNIEFDSKSLFSWQKANSKSSDNGLSLPVFDTAVSSTKTWMPSFYHFLHQGRPSFAFAMILLRWSNLQGKKQISYLSRTITNVKKIAYQNMDNDVILSGSSVLLTMLGESPVFVRVKVRFLQYLKRSKFVLSSKDINKIPSHVYFKLAKKLIDVYKTDRMKSDSNPYIEFLNKNAFLFLLFPQYVHEFPITEMAAMNNDQPYVFWVDILIFAHKYGLPVEKFMYLIKKLQESPLTEHMTLCFNNYDTHAQAITKTPTSDRRSAYLNNVLLPGKKNVPPDDSGKETSRSQKVKINENVKTMRGGSNNSEEDSVSSSGEAKSFPIFNSLSSILKLIKSHQDPNEFSKFLVNYKRPLLMAGAYQALLIKPETFLFYFLHSSGIGIPPEAHMEPNLLSYSGVQPLIHANLVVDSKSECEPFEPTHLSIKFLEAVSLVEDDSKSLEVFMEFMETFALESGASHGGNYENLFMTVMKTLHNSALHQKCIVMFSPVQNEVSNNKLWKLCDQLMKMNILLPFHTDIASFICDESVFVQYLHSLLEKLIANSMLQEADDVLHLARSHGILLDDLWIQTKFLPFKSNILKKKELRRCFLKFLLTITAALPDAEPHEIGMRPLIEQEELQIQPRVDRRKQLMLEQITDLDVMDLSEMGFLLQQLLKRRVSRYLVLKVHTKFLAGLIELVNKEESLDETLDEYFKFADNKTFQQEFDITIEDFSFLKTRKQTSMDAPVQKLVGMMLQNNMIFSAISISQSLHKCTVDLRFIIIAKLVHSNMTSFVDFAHFPEFSTFGLNETFVDVVTKLREKAEYGKEYLMYLILTKKVQSLVGESLQPSDSMQLLLQQNQLQIFQDLIVFEYITKEKAIREVLQHLANSYKTNEQKDLNLRLNDMLDILPDKSQCGTKLCAVSETLVRQNRYFGATSLLGHAAYCFVSSSNVSGLNWIAKQCGELLQRFEDISELKLYVHMLRSVQLSEVQSCAIDALVDTGLLTDFVDKEKNLALKLKNILLPVLTKSKTSAFQSCLKSLDMHREFADIQFAKAQDHIDLCTIGVAKHELRQFLDNAIKFYHNASISYMAEKMYDKSVYCIDQARLATLQIDIHERGIRVLALSKCSESDFFEVIEQLKSPVQIAVVLKAYEKVGEYLPKIIYSKVLQNGDLNFLKVLAPQVDLSERVLSDLKTLMRLDGSLKNAKLNKNLQHILQLFNDKSVPKQIFR